MASTYSIVEPLDPQTGMTLISVTGPATVAAGGHQIYVSAAGVTTPADLLTRYQNVADQVENSFAERAAVAAQLNP